MTSTSTHGTGRDTVAHMQQRWMSAFDRADWEALEQLYTPDALLFGGKPDLYCGPGGVLAYFGALAAGGSATFGETTILASSSSLILTAGFVTFQREAIARPHRMSWTLLKDFQGWRIASHHASPRTDPVGKVAAL